MTYSYNKLKGRIVEKYDSFSAFADALGITRQAVSQKLNNERKFTQDDISEWADKLDIADTEIGVYFFTVLV